MSFLALPSRSLFSKVGIDYCDCFLLHWSYHTDCIPQLWYTSRWSNNRWHWCRDIGYGCSFVRRIPKLLPTLANNTRYISEVAPPNLRGSLLVLEQIAIVIGAISAYWITYGTREIPSDWAFRLPFVLQMVPALCVGCGIHFFPYSPRWLAMRHKDAAALESISKLRRLPFNDERVQLEHKGILAEVRMMEEITKQQHPTSSNLAIEMWSWLDLFRPRYLKRTMISLVIPFFQQFSGINSFVYYAPIFFASLNQSYEMSLILSGMINICQLVAGLPAFAFFDKIGRRKIAIFGGFAMAIPHFIMSGIVAKYSSSWEEHPGMGWFGVALIYIYVLAFAFTYGPLAWVLPAELWSNTKRAKGVGISVAMNWASNFVIGVVS